MWGIHATFYHCSEISSIVFFGLKCPEIKMIVFILDLIPVLPCCAETFTFLAMILLLSVITIITDVRPMNVKIPI